MCIADMKLGMRYDVQQSNVAIVAAADQPNIGVRRDRWRIIFAWNDSIDILVGFSVRVVHQIGNLLIDVAAIVAEKPYVELSLDTHGSIVYGPFKLVAPGHEGQFVSVSELVITSNPEVEQ